MGPDNNRRILIATVLSMVILFGYQYFFAPKPTPQARRAEPAAASATAPKPSEPAAAAPGGATAAATAPVPDAPEQTVVLDSPEVTATFTSHGGALKSFVLKGEKFRRQETGKQPAQVDLVHVAAGEPLPLATVPADGATPLADPAARAPMRIVSTDARSVSFEGVVGGAKVTKRFALTDKPYEIAVQLHVEAGAAGALGLVYTGYAPPAAQQPGSCSLFTGGEIQETVQAMCRASGKTVRFQSGSAPAVAGTPRFVGLDQHYFVSVLMPEPEAGSCALVPSGNAGGVASILKLPYDRALDAKLRLYAGPKQLELLQGYGRELDTAIDYGAVANLFAFFARMLLWIMRQAFAIVHNWGLAIILLTLLVKLALYPLTAKSMQSMNEMRKLQPEIEKLKARYGDDREKMNVAVMQLYQQHKVNPLGGCLPLLLQMPVFFALYATLQTSVELYREPFLWIADLTRYDPLYILPLAMGVSQFVMQKLSPQPADNTQAKMMLYFMPVFFTFIMFKLPAGLALYIFANNLISMGQQQWLMRRSQATEPAATA